LAMVINEVFQAPDLGPSAAPVTVLEGLREGVAARLAVLGDASVTGTSQSSAEVLGIDVPSLARLLASHLVREIIRRGARGSILAPLADQLNHDLTHLQGRRLEGVLADLVQVVRDALAQMSSGVATRPGLPADWEDLLTEMDARLACGEASRAQTGALGRVGKTAAARRTVGTARDLTPPPAGSSPYLIKACSDLQADTRLHDVAAFLYEASGVVDSPKAGSRVSADRRAIALSAGAIQQALACAVRAGEEGAFLPPSLLAASKRVVDFIVDADPDLISLRYNLAKLHGRMDDYGGALIEINEIVKGPDPPHALCLNFAGEMLMNLGHITSADHVSCALSSSDERSPAVIAPLSDEDRLREWIRSEQFRKIWLPDYRGYTQESLRSAKLLLPEARMLGGDVLETILHRLARAQCDLGAERRDVGMVEAGIRTNQAARAAVPDEDKPLSYLLDYSAMSSMRLPGAERSWGVAKEHVEGRPDPVRAHLLLASGKRLRAEAPLAAISDLENALEIWAGHPYPAGACDALVELGLAYSQLGTRAMRIQALEYFGAARLISERFTFATKKNIRRYVDLCACRLEITDGQVRILAEERLARWPQLCIAHDLSRSGLRELCSFIEADALLD
jgi:tetratricopeptide (TPR) repeat protein